MKKPAWFKTAPIGTKNFIELKKTLKERHLCTVCQEAKCPNIAECWQNKTATFMVLGDTCTRNCAFCAIKKTKDFSSLPSPSNDEIQNITKTIKELGLKHAVITQVTRDDLKDGGANHFLNLCNEIHNTSPTCTIELLISDLEGNLESLKTILSANIQVLNHNIETVPSLYKKVRQLANYDRSLKILKEAKNICPQVKTKTGMMLGLGETKEEVLNTMDDLRKIDVDFLTLGQYLQPTTKQVPIDRYITPEEFNEYKEIALKKGFLGVESSPLVRSSYHAKKMIEG